MGDRSTKAVTLLTAQALTGSGSQTGIKADAYRECTLFLTITPVTGTLPVALFKLQISEDDTTYYDHPDFRVPIQATAARTAVRTIEGLANYVRLAYTLSGTSPSFTTTAVVVLKN